MPMTGERTTDAAITVATVLGPVPADAARRRRGPRGAALGAAGGGVRLRHHHGPSRDLRDPGAPSSTDFREHGGGTIVDSTGMFHGRDVPLLEALSRSTGVHVVASTGHGPRGDARRLLPHPADQPADPVAGGEVRRPLRPRGHRGHGRAARRAPRRRRARGHRRHPRGHDRHRREPVPRRGPGRAGHRRRRSRSASAPTPSHDLEVVLDEGLPADRVVVGGLDRTRRRRRRWPARGRRARRLRRARPRRAPGDDDHVTDAERVALVAELVRAGYGDRVLLSSNATGRGQGARPATTCPTATC